MTTPVIETTGLEKKYGAVTAVGGIDLRVEKGEIFGLVGADGAGKTSIIQMLCTLSLPTSGTGRILGMDLIHDAGRIKDKIGYVSERFNLYPTLTVDENLDFFARLRNLPRATTETRKKELLSFCRMEPFRGRQAQYLSGGMQKKLALACSLIHEPEVIFLDEPTTGVDPVSRRDFWKLITGFLATGITVLVSTPYLDEAERFNRVAFIHKGKIIACDTPRNLKTSSGAEILQIEAVPVQKAMAALKEAAVENAHLFGEIIHIISDNAARQGPVIKALLEKHAVTVKRMETAPPSLEDALIKKLAIIESKDAAVPAAVHGLHIDRGGVHSQSAVQIIDLTKKFGDFTAVDHVSFEVGRGEIFGLLGPNGSGKTTTIRMITGLLEPTSGKTTVLGQELTGNDGELRRRMGYMSQKFSLFEDLTVDENIRFYGGLYGLNPAQFKQGREWVLEMAGLRGKEKMMPKALSGGWKRRLALGCAIIHGPEVVFLDEPTSGVDPLSRRSFWELIEELSNSGTTVFVTTHYMDEAEHCHRLGMFHQGRLIAMGKPNELKIGLIKGQVAEVVTPDFARALELLSADPRYPQISLFGSNLHLRVEDVQAAAGDIKGKLERGGARVESITRIPFTMEDVFIALVEEQTPAAAGKP